MKQQSAMGNRNRFYRGQAARMQQQQQQQQTAVLSLNRFDMESNEASTTATNTTGGTTANTTPTPTTPNPAPPGTAGYMQPQGTGLFTLRNVPREGENMRRSMQIIN